MRKFLLLLVLCLGSVGATFAQIKISGKVVDAETGQPLIGATVMIGTTTGVATLADGTYVLPVPASAGEHPVLTFTYIGYESLNVTVGKNHVVNAKLKPEVVIDQIVVTGFKNAKKESFTGFVGQDFGRRRRHRGRHGREPYARRTGGRRIGTERFEHLR